VGRALPGLNPETFDQPFHVFFEQVLIDAVAPTAAATAQRKDRTRPWIGFPALTLPSPLDALAGELAVVVAGAQVHMAVVPPHFVHPDR